MKSIAINLAIWLVFITTCYEYASAAGSQEDRRARHIVVRLYELTESLNERCSYAAPEVAEKFKREISRFIATNTALINLVKQSPHYEYAQKNFKYDKQSNPDTKDCGYFGDVIGAMIDTPEGRAEMEKFTAILSK